nr:MAG TPA: hypothetical protein [Caudoviricetes sp.]
MNKRYISGTCLSINLSFGSSYRHIAFEPQMESGSAYISGDKEEQEALEAHPYYGEYFEEDSYYQDSSEVSDQATAVGEEHSAKSEGVTLTFSNESDAKEYLAENYGISRTRMKSRNSIENVATEQGVSIVWTDNLSTEEPTETSHVEE